MTGSCVARYAISESAIDLSVMSRMSASTAGSSSQSVDSMRMSARRTSWSGRREVVETTGKLAVLPTIWARVVPSITAAAVLANTTMPSRLTTTTPSVLLSTAPRSGSRHWSAGRAAP